MLGQALSLGTKHLSLYQLTIEPGTRFAAMHAAGKLKPLDLDAAAALYELTDAMTSEAGLPAYEISNHARPGQESRHNLTYWRYGDYAGVGPGAHGRRLGMRTVRHRKPENFLSALHRNGHGIAEEAPLSPGEAADEALVMGLRLAEGIDAGSDRGALRACDSVVDWKRVERLVGSGHLERERLAHRADRERAAAARPYPRRDCGRASLGLWRLRSCWPESPTGGVVAVGADFGALRLAMNL